jgi:hypothetical protein
MKSRLHELALSFPHGAFAGKQPFTRERTEGVPEQFRLPEILLLLYKNLLRQVRMAQVVYVERSESVVGDIAILARNAERKGQRVKPENGGQHLTEQCEREIDSWPIRVFWFCHGRAVLFRVPELPGAWGDSRLALPPTRRAMHKTLAPMAHHLGTQVRE